jgi:succinate dehydrogenase / fumarate reductase cytochrome b subunit
MTEQNPSVQRPLSPHLQVYRLPLLPLMSISHRVTGVGLAFGTLVLARWLAALATGPGAYAVFTAFMMPLGGLALLGWMIAIAYHFCNGIRHLIWDTGHSLDLESAEKAGIAVLIGWVILSAAMVALALFFWLT